MIRVFGVEKCKKCVALVNALEKAGVSFFYVDADADHTQALCDSQNVDALPHIQILDNNKRVVFQHIGFISPDAIKQAASEHGLTKNR